MEKLGTTCITYSASLRKTVCETETESETKTKDESEIETKTRSETEIESEIKTKAESESETAKKQYLNLLAPAHNRRLQNVKDSDLATLVCCDFGQDFDGRQGQDDLTLKQRAIYIKELLINATLKCSLKECADSAQKSHYCGRITP